MYMYCISSQQNPDIHTVHVHRCTANACCNLLQRHQMRLNCEYIVTYHMKQNTGARVYNVHVKMYKFVYCMASPTCTCTNMFPNNGIGTQTKSKCICFIFLYLITQSSVITGRTFAVQSCHSLIHVKKKPCFFSGLQPHI